MRHNLAKIRDKPVFSRVQGLYNNLSLFLTGERGMKIYIEYALAENFLIDAMMLWLALKAAKQPIQLWRIALASAIGAIFAVCFPLLKVPSSFAYVLKFAAGILLCLVAVKGKGVGRYAMTIVLFFGFSFALGGMLLALYSAFSVDYSIAEGGYFTESAPVGMVLSGSFVFVVTTLTLVKKLYKKRALRRFVYPCRITLGDRIVEADGFLDSGNRAKAGGAPVCFLSPDLVYDLLGERTMTEEMTVVTVSGETKIKIFPADSLEIYCGEKANIIKKVYFAPSGNIRARDYKIILNAAVLD